MLEIILFSALLLIIADIFFSNEIPTHIGYILLVVLFIINTASIFLGIIIWFGLLVFHYTIWRKLLEKFHDTIIAPQKHASGIEGLIGKEGTIIKIEGQLFIEIDKEIYQFEIATGKEIYLGNTYKVLRINSNKLLI